MDGVRLLPGLLKYFADALERDREWLEVFGLADSTKSIQTLARVHEIIGTGTEYGVDLVVAETVFLAKNITRTVAQEIEDLRFLLRRNIFLGRMRQEYLERLTDRERNRNGKLLLEDNLHDAKSGPAQSEGITGTARNDTNGKAASDGVQLVRNRNGAAGQIARHRIIQADWQVVIVDCVGHFLRFTLGPCVKAAHHALQLCELPYHFSCKVTFGKFGSAVGFCDMCLHQPEVEPLLHKPTDQN